MGDLNDPFMRNKDAAVQARTKAQNRANVLQLKLIGQSHPTGLTTNLLKLFEPRPPLEYKPPPEKKKCPPYTGMAQYVSGFAEPGQPEYAPPVQKGETRAQKKARIQKLRLEKGAIKAAEDLEKYDPTKDPNISGDPYKTLFVARLSYETTEHRIKREFEAYGPIKRVRLITDNETNKPRGYGFIEYMHTRDMKTAYKQADGRKLDNRRVLVDVERGRTVPNWRPRRLGGGLGSTRVGGEEVNQKHSGREQQQQQIASGGPPRSEEPRVRDDRQREVEREKSRDRGREREKSHDRPHDRTRDRDTREDSRLHHTRDRDRYRERDRGRDQDRIRSRDDRDRGRDFDRDRNRDRPRERERGRERERDYDRTSHEKDRGYSHGRDVEYDHLEPARDKEQTASRERDLGHGGYDDGEEWYTDPIKHRREHDYDHYEKPRSQERYERLPPLDLNEPERSAKRLKSHEPEYYDQEPYDKVHRDGGPQGRFDHADPEPREEGEAVDEHDYAYQRTERSLSREYRG